jgi:hypothetical protein
MNIKKYRGHLLNSIKSECSELLTKIKSNILIDPFDAALEVLGINQVEYEKLRDNDLKTGTGGYGFRAAFSDLVAKIRDRTDVGDNLEDGSKTVGERSIDETIKLVDAIKNRNRAKSSASNKDSEKGDNVPVVKRSVEDTIKLVNDIRNKNKVNTSTSNKNSKKAGSRPVVIRSVEDTIKLVNDIRNRNRANSSLLQLTAKKN